MGNVPGYGIIPKAHRKAHVHLPKQILEMLLLFTP